MPDPVTWFVLLSYRICCALIHILESIKRFIIEILIGYQSETLQNAPVTEVCDQINKCQSCGSILSTKRAKLRYRTRTCKKTKTTTNRKRNRNNFSRGIKFYNSKFECNLQKAKKVTLTFEFSPDNNEIGETSSTINKFVSCSQSDIPESESEVSPREFNQATASANPTEIGENPTIINGLVLSSQSNAPESESVKSPGKFKEAAISIASTENGERFSIKNALVFSQSHAPESESLRSLGEFFHTSGFAASIEIPENSPIINLPDDSSQSDYPESESVKSPVEFKQIVISATSTETILKDDQEKESLASNNSQLLSCEINHAAASQTLTLGQDSNALSFNKLSYSYEQEKTFCASKDFQGSFTELYEATVTDVTTKTMSKDLETKENLASNNSRYIDYELIHTDVYYESTETILKDEKDKESSSLNQLQCLTLEFNQTSGSDKSTEKKLRDKQEKDSVDSSDLQSSSFEINLTSVNMEANLREEHGKETLKSDDFEISSGLFNQAIHEKIGETMLENKLETSDFTKNSLKRLCCDLEIDIKTSEEKHKSSRSYECQSNQDTKLKYQDDRITVLDEEIIVPGEHEITNTCKKLKTSNDEELQHQAMNFPTNIKSKKSGFDIDASKIGKSEPIIETTYNTAKTKSNTQTEVSTQPEILLETDVISQSKVLIGAVDIQLESLNASEVPQILNGEQINTDPKVFQTSDADIQSKVLPYSDVNIQTNIFSEVHGSVEPESLTLSDVSDQQKFLPESGFGKQSEILSESLANLQMEVFPAAKGTLQMKVLPVAQASPQVEVLPAKQASRQVEVFSAIQANSQTEMLSGAQAKAPMEGLMESDVGTQTELLVESDIRTQCSGAVGIQLESLILSDDNADFHDLTVVPINSPLVQSKISPESNVGARSKILSEVHDNLLSESLTLSDASAQQKVLPDSGLVEKSKALPEFYVTDQQGVMSEAQALGQTEILTESDVCAQTVVFPEDNGRTLPTALLDRSQSLLLDFQLTDGKILEQKIIKGECDSPLQSVLMTKAKSKSEKVLTLQEKECDAIHSGTPLTHDISMLTSIFSESCNIQSSQVLQKQDNFVQPCASSEKENFEITKNLQEKNYNKSKVLNFLEILKKENNEALNSEITTSSKLELFPSIEMRKCFPEKRENNQSQFPPKTEKNVRSEIFKAKTCSAEPNVSFVKEDMVKQKIPQIKSDSVKSNVFPEKSNSVKSSGARKKVKRLQRGVQTKDLPTDLSSYENNLSLFQEMYTKTNDPKFSKDKSVHSKISEKDESHKDILDKGSNDKGMDFKITEMTENDKWSNLNSDLPVYSEVSTLSFDKAPPLFIDTHSSSENIEVCFATIPTLPNFDFKDEYPVHIFNKNDILLYNYFTDYQISESEISQSLDNFKINKNQIKSGYNPMLRLPKYWDKMRTDGDRVIVEKCEIKCYFRNTDVSEDVVNKSCINLEESVIADKNDRELYSTNTYGNKKRKALSNLDSKTKCTSDISRGDTRFDTLSDAETSDADDPEFSIFVHSSSETKDQHLEALSSIKVHELFHPVQQLDSSNQSSFQHKQKLIPESSELVKYASENVTKSPAGKEKIIQEDLSFETQNVGGKKNICSANKFKTSVTQSKYEEELNPSYPTPKFLISFRRADFNYAAGQNSRRKKLEPDEDNLKIKWNTSDKIFYEYVMKSDSSESDLAVAEDKSKHSLGESVLNHITGAPSICDGMYEKENRVYLGKRVIKSVNENQVNEEEKNNKELTDIFQGADENIERMKILKLPTNSPPKRRKNVSSPSGSITFNSEVRNKASMFDSRKCDYKVNENFPIPIIETNLTKDEYDSNVKETKQIESTDFVFKTEYSSKECNTKMNIMSGPAQKINTLPLIKDEYDSNKTKNVEYEVSTTETDNSSESDKNISKTLRTSVQEANDNIPSTEDESHFKETKNMECVTSVLGTVKASSECDHETEIEATVSVNYLDDSLPSTEDESETNRE